MLLWTPGTVNSMCMTIVRGHTQMSDRKVLPLPCKNIQIVSQADQRHFYQPVRHIVTHRALPDVTNQIFKLKKQMFKVRKQL